jgi:hypothetical protein
MRRTSLSLLVLVAIAAAPVVAVAEPPPRIEQVNEQLLQQDRGAVVQVLTLGHVVELAVLELTPAAAAAVAIEISVTDAARLENAMIVPSQDGRAPPSTRSVSERLLSAATSVRSPILEFNPPGGRTMRWCS